MGFVSEPLGKAATRPPSLPGLESWFNFYFLLPPFPQEEPHSMYTQEKQNSFCPLLFLHNIYFDGVSDCCWQTGMIVLNTVIAWLVNYCTHYFSVYLLNHCHAMFPPPPFKNNGNFLCFLFGRKCWIVTSCFFALPEQTALFCFSHNWDPTNLAPLKKWNNLFVEASLV